MWEDPIVEEVRKARQEHAARFNYDLRAIWDDLKKRQNILDDSGAVVSHVCRPRVKRLRKDETG